MNTTNINKEEINNLNFQILFSAIFLLTTSLSIIISYNRLYHLKYNKYLFSKKLSNNLTKINRIIILFLLLGFLWLSFNTKKIDKAKGQDTIPDDLEIVASLLYLISGIIILYVVFNYSNETLVTTENPDI